MKSELDEILDALPRTGQKGIEADGYPRIEPNAWVYIDAAGRLVILPVNGGWLALPERKHGSLEADVAPFGG